MRANYHLFFIVLVIFIVSCRNNDKKKEIIAKPKLLKSANQKTDTVKENQEIIDYPCAIVIVPDEKAIRKLKRSYSEDDYNTIVDDNVNYMSESTTFLDSVKAKQIQKEFKRNPKE
jgi:hypothetical protein